MFKILLSLLASPWKPAHVLRLDEPGKAAHSLIHIDSEGRRHVLDVGTTVYGKGKAPAGGHRPDILISASPVPLQGEHECTCGEKHQVISGGADTSRMREMLTGTVITANCRMMTFTASDESRDR